MKVDELYRALAQSKPYVINGNGYSRCLQCLVLGDWQSGDTRHSKECLYAEAVEYVSNNPKEQR